MSTKSEASRITDVLSYVHFGYLHPRVSTTGALLRELHSLKPDHLILALGGRGSDVTMPMLAQMLLASGYGLREICPLEIRIPRSGWVLLVPRPPATRPRLKFNLSNPIQLPPRRCTQWQAKTSD
jgi:hypothetical protein